MINTDSNAGRKGGREGGGQTGEGQDEKRGSRVEGREEGGVASVALSIDGVTRKTIFDPKGSNRSIDRSSQSNFQLGSKMSKGVRGLTPPDGEPTSPAGELAPMAPLNRWARAAGGRSGSAAGRRARRLVAKWVPLRG